MAISAALTRYYDRTKSLDLNPKRGLVSEGIDVGVGMGASYIFGELHGRYGEEVEFKIPGTDKHVPLNLAIGVLGKGAAIALDMFTGFGHGHHVNTVANAGLYSFAFAKGVANGHDASGSSMPSLPRKTTVVGDLPAVPRGTFLSDDEIQHFATRGR